MVSEEAQRESKITRLTTEPPSKEASPAPSPDAELLATLGAALPELPPEQRAVLAGFLSRATVEAGTLVVKEGERPRDLVIIAHGEAQALRGGVVLDTLRSGDRFGDLSFVTAMPQPTALVATTRVDVLRLSLDRYRLLSVSHPELGVSLFEALLAGLTRHVPRGAVPGAAIVQDRSLPRRASVEVRIQGAPRVVPTGTRVRHLLPERVQGKLVVAALVDRKAVSLTTPITSECEVAPLTTGHWEGQRVHRQSLALLALEAARRLAPPAAIEMGPSIGFAQRIIVSDAAGRSLPALALDLEQSMRALVRERVCLREEWWTVDEAREYFEKQGSQAAALLGTWRDPAVPLVSFGEIYVLQMDPLVPDTGMLEGFHVMPGDDVLLLAYGQEASALPKASSMFPAIVVPGTQRPPESEAAYVERHARRASAHAKNLMLGQEQWLAALDVRSVGALNGACVGGDVPQLIRVSEGFHEKRIGTVADEIRERKKDIAVICIAGPSSSGKTTFIQRLQVQLQVNGLQPISLSLDDYYMDRERTPRDAAGELDYEALEAVQVDLLGEHLRRLLAGDRVKTARYDFASGRSQPEGGKEISLGPSQILLLEGIHGLNPGLLGAVPVDRVFRIFCCPLAQLPFDSLTRVHASDVRLIRRIVRDRHSRGCTAAENIVRWPSVREGERQHIFPFQHHADAVFDSSLVYELNVLRVFAERYLLEVSQDHAAYGTAFRLIRLLDRFVAIYPDHVPPTSILREFIGGSGFRY